MQGEGLQLKQEVGGTEDYNILNSIRTFYFDGLSLLFLFLFSSFLKQLWKSIKKYLKESKAQI